MPDETKKDDGKKTPAEWKAALGTPEYDYGPAELLHDWSTHELHAGGKRLSEQDYVKAIEAGRKPDSKGEYHPHPPAQGDFLADGSRRSASPASSPKGKE
jgi:hypothetical protein